MESRTTDSYQTQIGDFLKFDIFVVCPNCSKKAIVKSDCASPNVQDVHKTKVICPNCGYSKLLLEKSISIIHSSKDQKIIGRYYIIGADIDPFFQLPLWLRNEFEGNVLWAYNYEHLNFIRKHVEAKLRERNGQDKSNKSVGSRLPKWMVSKKNRDIVLKKINDLQNK